MKRRATQKPRPVDVMLEMMDELAMKYSDSESSLTEIGEDKWMLDVAVGDLALSVYWGVNGPFNVFRRKATESRRTRMFDITPPSEKDGELFNTRGEALAQVDALLAAEMKQKASAP
jgi:hypothetical protein